MSSREQRGLDQLGAARIHRTPVVAAALAAAVAALAFWLPGGFGSGDEEDRRSDARTVGIEAGARHGRAVANADGTRPVDSRSRIPLPAEAGGSGARISGQVTVLDPEPRPLAEGALSIALPLPDGGLSAARSLSVSDGAFGLEAGPEVGELFVFYAEAAGAKLWPTASRHPVVDGRRVSVELAPTPALFVVDAADGADLDEFTYCYGNQLPHGALRPSTGTHVGISLATVAAHRASSPAPLSTFPTLGELFVTAEGHAWRRASLANLRRVQTVLRLDRCGAVRVELRGADEQTAPHWIFRFDRLDADAGGSGRLARLPAYEFGPDGNWTDTPNALFFEKLLPGSYDLKLYESVEGLDTAALASAKLSVREGETTACTLEVSNVLRPPPGEVSIAVVGDADAIELVERLVISPIKYGKLPARHLAHRLEVGDAKRSEGYIEWRADGMRTAQYELSLEPLHYVAYREVTDEPAQFLVVELPALQDIAVECVAKDSGALAEIRAYQFLSSEATDVDQLGELLARGRLNDGANPMRARVVPGLVRFSVVLPGLQRRRFILDTRAQSSFRIEIEPARPVTLELKTRGGPLFQPTAWWTRSTFRTLAPEGSWVGSLRFDSPRDRSADDDWHSAVELTCFGPGPFEWTVPRPGGGTAPAATVSFLAADENVVVDLTGLMCPVGQGECE